MTNKTLLFLAVMGCSTTSTPLPEKVYDFSSRPLATIPTPTSSHSAKAQIRTAFDQLQPQLVRCTAGTTGELAITVRLVLDTGQPATLESADVAYPDAAAAACVRDAAAAIDLSHLDVKESAVWIVHMPYVVGANS
jgi:hypothetical protein